MSSATSLADRRRAEIEAKRSKLAALKKQREERTRQASRHDRLASVPPYLSTSPSIIFFCVLYFPCRISNFQPPPPTIRDRPDIDEIVNSLVGSGASRGGSASTSRPESRMSSSGMSDSEGGSQLQGHGRGQGQAGQGVSFAQGNFSATLLPPILDIAPAKVEVGEKEVVTYSKEVQTSAWTPPPEEDGEEDGEDVVRRRVEEELRRELEKLKIEEERL